MREVGVAFVLGILKPSPGLLAASALCYGAAPQGNVVL